MLELGGVPTEERFRKLTEAQWAFIIQKHMDKKMEKYENSLGLVEYLAQLVSPNPKAVMDVIALRRKKMEEAKLENDPNYLGEDEKQVVRRYSIDGEIVNTSFEDAIRQEISGNNQDAIMQQVFGDNYSSKPVVYTVDKEQIDYLKNHGDLTQKMEAIVQGKQEGVPPMIQNHQLSQGEQEALKDLGFDTIEF